MKSSRIPTLVQRHHSALLGSHLLQDLELLLFSINIHLSPTAAVLFVQERQVLDDAEEWQEEKHRVEQVLCARRFVRCARRATLLGRLHAKPSVAATRGRVDAILAEVAGGTFDPRIGVDADAA